MAQNMGEMTPYTCVSGVSNVRWQKQQQSKWTATGEQLRTMPPQQLLQRRDSRTDTAAIPVTNCHHLAAAAIPQTTDTATRSTAIPATRHQDTQLQRIAHSMMSIPDPAWRHRGTHGGLRYDDVRTDRRSWQPRSGRSDRANGDTDPRQQHWHVQGEYWTPPIRDRVQRLEV